MSIRRPQALEGQPAETYFSTTLGHASARFPLSRNPVSVVYVAHTSFPFRRQGFLSFSFGNLFLRLSKPALLNSEALSGVLVDEQGSFSADCLYPMAVECSPYPPSQSFVFPVKTFADVFRMSTILRLDVQCQSLPSRAMGWRKRLRNCFTKPRAWSCKTKQNLTWNKDKAKIRSRIENGKETGMS